MIRIYHNPRCRKSREVLEILKRRKEDIEIIEYMKNPPTINDLKWLVSKLKIRPEELIRKNEETYKKKFRDKVLTDDEWIRVISENPVLMERPVVVKGSHVVLARPPEKINLLP